MRKKTKSNYRAVFITCANFTEGEKIAQAVVEKKIVACCNIIPKITSIYWWKDKIEKSEEVLLLLKTTKNKIKKLTKEVKKIHSYEVFELVALPILEGNKKYLKWIAENLI